MQNRALFASAVAIGIGLSAAAEEWQGYVVDQGVAVAGVVTNALPADAPYRNPDLDVERRIDDLLPRLTPMEKVHLIHSTGGSTMGNIPPLEKSAPTILIAGPYADRRHAMREGDTRLSLCGGAAAVKAAREITPLEGFRTVFGAANVRTADGFAAERAQAATCDLVVYCGGIDHTFDAEAGGGGHVEPNDRRDLFLEAENGRVQEDEIAALAAVNPNVIVLLNGGAPVSVEEWHEKVKAIFVTWYGGEFGGDVVARMVKGEVNPSGRLPYTYGRTLHDWPAVRYGVRSYPGEWALVDDGRKGWARDWGKTRS